MKDYPAISFSASFAAGIVAQKIFMLPIAMLGALLCAAGILLVINFMFYKFVWLKYSTVVLAACLLGAIVFQFNGKEKVEPLSAEAALKNFSVSGEIVSVQLPTKKNFSFLLEVVSPSSKVEKKKILVRIKSSRSAFEKNRDLISAGNKIHITGLYSQGRDRRNPGEFDYKEYLLSEGISGIVYAKSIDDVKLISRGEKYFANLIFEVRCSIKKGVEKYFNSETAALMNALILADKSEISFETKKSFIETGVVHVLAVSGLHVAFVAVAFLFFFGRFELVWRIFLTCCGLLFFIIITNAPASVVRASIMAAVILVSYPSGRSTFGVNSLAVAALLILIFNPSDLFHPGFQLSFSAVLSILVLTPVLAEIFRVKSITNRYIKFVLNFFSVSLSAQIGTLPFTTYYFSKISLVALGANFFIIPLIAFILGGGIGVLLLSPISNHAASMIAVSINMITAILNSTVNFFASFDYSYLRVPNFSLTDALIVLSFIITFGILTNKNRPAIFTIIFTLLLLLNADLFIRLDDENLLDENKLNIFMIDIGQGDSFLIKFPNGKTALLDAGNATPQFDNGEKIILPLLEHLQIDKINFALVSHLDADHYAGFHSLVRKGKIERLIKPFPDSANKKDLEFERFLKANHVHISYFDGRTEIDSNVRLYNFVNHHADGFKSKTTNERSSFFLMKYGDCEILFTGDAPARLEKFVAQKFSPMLHADILKVGHHGSRTSTSENFLDLVNPKTALISAGIGNMFKHPSKVILERLAKDSIEVYRTDLNGAVILTSDGKKFLIKNWK